MDMGYFMVFFGNWRLIESKGLNAVGCRTPSGPPGVIWVEAFALLVDEFTNGIFIDDYYFVLFD